MLNADNLSVILTRAVYSLISLYTKTVPINKRDRSPFFLLERTLGERSFSDRNVKVICITSNMESGRGETERLGPTDRVT